MAVVGTETKIADALFFHLQGLVVTPALPISWPGLVYQPTTGTAYLRCDYLPNRSRPAVVTPGAAEVRQGLLQVSVFWPASPARGVVGPLGVQQLVMDRFASGTRLARNGVVVKVIEHPWPAPPLEEPDWLQFPTTIPWISIAA